MTIALMFQCSLINPAELGNSLRMLLLPFFLNSIKTPCREAILRASNYIKRIITFAFDIVSRHSLSYSIRAASRLCAAIVRSFCRTYGSSPTWEYILNDTSPCLVHTFCNLSSLFCFSCSDFSLASSFGLGWRYRILLDAVEFRDEGSRASWRGSVFICISSGPFSLSNSILFDVWFSRNEKSDFASLKFRFQPHLDWSNFSLPKFTLQWIQPLPPWTSQNLLNHIQYPKLRRVSTLHKRLHYLHWSMMFSDSSNRSLSKCPMTSWERVSRSLRFL